MWKKIIISPTQFKKIHVVTIEIQTYGFYFYLQQRQYITAEFKQKTSERSLNNGKYFLLKTKFLPSKLRSSVNFTTDRIFEGS